MNNYNEIQTEWIGLMGKAVECGRATDGDLKTAQWVLEYDRLPIALANSAQVRRLVRAGVLHIESDGTYYLYIPGRTLAAAEGR